jgi:hypothetical protein
MRGEDQQPQDLKQIGGRQHVIKKADLLRLSSHHAFSRATTATDVQHLAQLVCQIGRPTLATDKDARLDMVRSAACSPLLKLSSVHM